jgi:hypothetical protein
MTETTTTDAGALRVMLKLEQSMHDATKRQVTSLKAKLARKPEVIKVPTEAFRPICDADFEIDSEIIGYDEVTGAVYAAVWTRGSVSKRVPDPAKGRMVHVCEDVTGWWVNNSVWHPTHFIPMPKRP